MDVPKIKLLDLCWHTDLGWLLQDEFGSSRIGIKLAILTFESIDFSDYSQMVYNHPDNTQGLRDSTSLAHSWWTSSVVVLTKLRSKTLHTYCSALIYCNSLIIRSHVTFLHKPLKKDSYCGLMMKMFILLVSDPSYVVGQPNWLSLEISWAVTSGMQQRNRPLRMQKLPQQAHLCLLMVMTQMINMYWQWTMLRKSWLFTRDSGSIPLC